MRAEHAWGAFTLVFALAVAVAAATFIGLGHDPYQVGAFATIALMVYLYVVYKRYHVEMVTPDDVMLFSDPDDLTILCRIYGLETAGDERADRLTLLGFARENMDRSFVWVAPKAVRSVSGALETPAPPEGDSEARDLMMRLLSDQASDEALTGPLPGGRRRSAARLAGIEECQVCGSRAKGAVVVCAECGADLEFYDTLAESRLGRRLLSEKAGARRGKLR